MEYTPSAVLDDEKVPDPPLVPPDISPSLSILPKCLQTKAGCPPIVVVGSSVPIPTVRFATVSTLVFGLNVSLSLLSTCKGL